MHPILIGCGADGAETGTSFELATNLGNGFALFGVSIQPGGLQFNTPITIIFAWADEDDDGKVDGTDIKEQDLIITRDNVAVTGRCEEQDSGCDMTVNTFSFEVSSLSEFALVFVDDVGPITSNVLATPNPACIAYVFVAGTPSVMLEVLKSASFLPFTTQKVVSSQVEGGSTHQQKLTRLILTSQAKLISVSSQSRRKVPQSQPVRQNSNSRLPI